ncbi:hypothetical protein BDN72DRAFT_594490 [Pluteus cervinus]|uniref:Uncharacterized protein n=1 Tax=Pluteus cervinus TaxID=181527 RepID=A0ACD3AVF9_9AGAR|nr:hypothetical protein BDN72DRAFT_594490 [Pluteus cervinus]
MAPEVHPALNLTGLSKEDAYHKIESEIIRLKDRIRSLLSVRNSLSAVSSLPNEILSKVFMHCCDFNELGTYSSIRSPNGAHDDRAQPEMRLVVSWVSRHWRSVALGHRPLWNQVVNLGRTINLDYVHSCAARCQHICVDLEGPTKSLLNTCGSNLSKTTYLKLNFSSTKMTLQRIWSSPAPLLRTLSLHTLNVRCDDTSVLAYPKLQSLALVECDFRWNFVNSLASTISKLEITDPKSTLTTPAYLRLLESLPRLSDCTLQYCISDSEDPAPAASHLNSVHLPHLTKMTLAESTDHLIQILRAVDIPHATLKVSLNEANSTINQHGADFFCALLESQKHVWGSIHYLQVRTWFTVANSKAKHDVYAPSIHLLQPLACRKLDFSALESLWTQTLSVEDLEVFSCLPQLHRVVLESSHTLETFVSFMCTEAHDGDSPVLFPALQELVLAYLDSQDWLEELRDILASRKIWGYGLQKLVLFRCDTVGIGELAQLKQVVDVEFCRTSLEDLLLT